MTSSARRRSAEAERGGAAAAGRAGRGLVLGTAGHIDHGKTALIRALTGVDTDRLPEEKRRGITIELGFAPLELGDGLHLSVVDVPGHERLVRTMVAGATGIDLVLLVVAADEGVMPQTREHLAICTLLGLGRGVLALTKTDRVDAEMQELADAEVEELLAGTPLEAAARVPVSALTGEGIEALRSALAEAAAAARDDAERAGPARLAVDRVFAARGFGCVVTGTLTGGALAVGDTVTLWPGGAAARVRGLQHFGEAADRVGPGARCAVNLAGVERAEVARGQLLAAPGALAPTGSFDVELFWLAEAPPLDAPASVELLVQTAERRARLAPIGEKGLAPGGRGFARVHVEGEPLALLPGDRFVVRGFARTAGGGATLGGGRVLDVAPPRRRRSDPLLARDLALLAGGDTAAGVRLRIERAGFAGIDQEALRRETGLAPETLQAIADAASAAGEVAALGERLLAREALETLETRLLKALDAFHRSEPLQPGAPRGALGSALPENAAPGALEALLARLERSGRLVLEEERARLPAHLPILTQRQEAFAAHLRAEAMAADLEPPAPREWLERLDVTEKELADLLAHLVRDGSLVRAPGGWFFDRGAVDELRERVAAYLREHEELDTTTYKQLIGTTRKWAVPLMELFDAEHLTKRRGDARVRGRSLSC